MCQNVIGTKSLSNMQAEESGSASAQSVASGSSKKDSPVKRAWARLSDSQRMLNFDDATLASECFSRSDPISASCPHISQQPTLLIQILFHLKPAYGAG